MCGAELAVCTLQCWLVDLADESGDSSSSRGVRLVRCSSSSSPLRASGAHPQWHPSHTPHSAATSSFVALCHSQTHPLPILLPPLVHMYCYVLLCTALYCSGRRPRTSWAVPWSAAASPRAPDSSVMASAAPMRMTRGDTLSAHRCE